MTTAQEYERQAAYEKDPIKRLVLLCKADEVRFKSQKTSKRQTRRVLRYSYDEAKIPKQSN